MENLKKMFLIALALMALTTLCSAFSLFGKTDAEKIVGTWYSSDNMRGPLGSEISNVQSECSITYKKDGFYTEVCINNFVMSNYSNGMIGLYPNPNGQYHVTHVIRSVIDGKWMIKDKIHTEKISYSKMFYVESHTNLKQSVARKKGEQLARQLSSRSLRGFRTLYKINELDDDKLFMTDMESGEKVFCWSSKDSLLQWREEGE